MQSVNFFIRRNLFSIGGLLVVSGVMIVFGQVTEAVIGYCAGLAVSSYVLK